MPEPEPAKYDITRTLVPVPGSIGLFQEVRTFSNANIQAAVDRVLASLPADSKGVQLTLEVDPATGVNAAVALKLSGTWSVSGAFNLSPGGDWAAGFGGAESKRRAVSGDVSGACGDCGAHSAAPDSRAPDLATFLGLGRWHESDRFDSEFWSRMSSLFLQRGLGLPVRRTHYRRLGRRADV